MKPNTFAERLNICLDKEGFPPKNCGRIQLLAEMVGLTHRGASKWVNGESTPPAGKYDALAQKLNVNATWLKTGEGSMLGSETHSPISQAMGLPQDVILYNIDEWPPKKNKNHERFIRCVLPYKGQFYGITLDSEAMSPRFPKNSIIVFDKKATLRDGDFILVKIDELPKPIFRQLMIVGSSYYLHAYNPKFDRITLAKNHKVLGKLVQAIISFE